MARRASSRISLATVLLCGFVLLAAIGGGSYFLIGSSNPFRTVQPLDTDAYLENANSLRGNIYRIDGVVQNSLSWSPAQGRLISVQIGEPKDSGETGETGKADRVAILVPAKFNHINLQKGQRYQFKVEIVKDGIIEASDLRKS
jgi:hypothetical protein